MADWDPFWAVKELAGCAEDCAIEAWRDASHPRTVVVHYQRGCRSALSNEAEMRLDDVDLEHEGFEQRKQRVITRFKTDHDHWANKPISLYNFDEEAERARLQPLYPTSRSFSTSSGWNSRSLPNLQPTPLR